MGRGLLEDTVDTEARDLKEKLQMSTAEIGLSLRTASCLDERGIFTVQDLLSFTRCDLLGASSFGEKTLEEVSKALETIGFHRKRRREAVAEREAKPV